MKANPKLDKIEVRDHSMNRDHLRFDFSDNTHFQVVIDHDVLLSDVIAGISKLLDNLKRYNRTGRMKLT